MADMLITIMLTAIFWGIFGIMAYFLERNTVRQFYSEKIDYKYNAPSESLYLYLGLLGPVGFVIAAVRILIYSDFND